MQRQDLYTRLHWFYKKKKEKIGERKRRIIKSGGLCRQGADSLVWRHTDSDGGEQGFIWDYLTA